MEEPTTIRESKATNSAILETCGTGFHWVYSPCWGELSLSAAEASRRGEHGARRDGAHEHAGEHVEGIVDAEVDPREGDEEG